MELQDLTGQNPSPPKLWDPVQPRYLKPDNLRNTLS
jgi:hypothetical protein